LSYALLHIQEVIIIFKIEGGFYFQLQSSLHSCYHYNGWLKADNTSSIYQESTY